MKNMSEREESYSTDPSDSSRISSNDSDGNEELGVQPYLYEPETNTEACDPKLMPTFPHHRNKRKKPSNVQPAEGNSCTYKRGEFGQAFGPHIATVSKKPKR